MMTHPDSTPQRALDLAVRLGMVRAREFVRAGIPLVTVGRLVAAGDLLRLDRGLYQLPARAGESADHDLAMAASLVPAGVVSHLSALRYHGLTTQLPAAVWLTLPHKARTPRRPRLRLEIVRASRAVPPEDIEETRIEGVLVRVFGVAKTVTDCFRQRRRVGEDVAVDALREALAVGRTTRAEILRCAALGRVGPRVARYLRSVP